MFTSEVKRFNPEVKHVQSESQTFQSGIERFQDELERVQDYVGNNGLSAASKGQFCSLLGKKAPFWGKAGAVTGTPPRRYGERRAAGERTASFTGFLGGNAGFPAFSGDENVHACAAHEATRRLVIPGMD
jgi:hypothetical protein